jgi:hypothetical protein
VLVLPGRTGDPAAAAVLSESVSIETRLAIVNAACGVVCSVVDAPVGLSEDSVQPLEEKAS